MAKFHPDKGRNTTFVGNGDDSSCDRLLLKVLPLQLAIVQPDLSCRKSTFVYTIELNVHIILRLIFSSYWILLPMEYHVCVLVIIITIQLLIHQ